MVFIPYICIEFKSLSPPPAQRGTTRQGMRKCKRWFRKLRTSVRLARKRARLRGSHDVLLVIPQKTLLEPVERSLLAVQIAQIHQMQFPLRITTLPERMPGGQIGYMKWWHEGRQASLIRLNILTKDVVTKQVSLMPCDSPAQPQLSCND